VHLSNHTPLYYDEYDISCIESTIMHDVKHYITRVFLQYHGWIALSDEREGEQLVCYGARKRIVGDNS